MIRTVRVLLERLIDYAGLFPPAALAMPEAADRYAASRAGPHAWMLGRFVVPAARLAELVDASASLSPERLETTWPLSVLLGPDVRRDLEVLAAATSTCRTAGLSVEAVELKADTAASVEQAAPDLGVGVERWFEVTAGPGLGAAVLAIREAGAGAKIRLGGVTPSAFPSTGDVAHLILACARSGVPFKATAGLHHPVRGSFRVTSADDSPRTTMHGFLNVFLAAPLARAVCRHGYPDPEGQAEIAALLEETDPAAFLWDDIGVRWRTHRLHADEIAESRRVLARSFGSCSFAEPVIELGQLGLLDAG